MSKHRPPSGRRQRSGPLRALVLAFTLVFALMIPGLATAASVPPVPAHVTATATSTSTIHVSWSAVSGATSYVVSNGNVSSPNLTSTGYDWTGLAPGTYMCFTVTAKNSAGQSPWSPYACTVTQVSTPTGVAVRATSATNFHVTWNSVPGATSYVVSNGNVSSYDLYDTQYDWTVTGPSTYMCFTITAKENSGQSPWSAYACTTSMSASADSYVNIGDSYSAGEGTFDYVAGTDTSANMCHRSTKSYSGQYSASSSHYPTVKNVACTGAVTDDLTSAPGAQNSMQIATAGELPQIDGLSSYTNAVTMTFGGNDLNLVWLLTNCYQQFLTPSIDSCFVNSINNALYAKINALESTLEDTYQSVKSAAPNATVIVLTYPQIYPATYSDVQYDCAAGPVTVLTSQNQINLIRGVVHRLDAVIKQAAAAQGVTVLDEENAFAGHELCTSDPWVNDIVDGVFTKDESFHPMVAGYAKEAADLKAYLDAIA